jgi:hypothetical protein
MLVTSVAPHWSPRADRTTRLGRFNQARSVPGLDRPKVPDAAHAPDQWLLRAAAYDRGIRVLKSLRLDRFIRKLTVSPRWKVELRNVARVDTVLDRDVLNGFCRCFIHADQLTSDQLHVRQRAIPRTRLEGVQPRSYLHGVVFGTLRELAPASNQGSPRRASSPWVTRSEQRTLEKSKSDCRWAGARRPPVPGSRSRHESRR